MKFKPSPVSSTPCAAPIRPIPSRGKTRPRRPRRTPTSNKRRSGRGTDVKSGRGTVGPANRGAELPRSSRHGGPAGTPAVAVSQETQGTLVCVAHGHELVVAGDSFRRTVYPHPGKSLFPAQRRRTQVLDLRAALLAFGLQHLRHRLAAVHHG